MNIYLCKRKTMHFLCMQFENWIGHVGRKESWLGCLDSLLIGPRRTYLEGIKHIQDQERYKNFSLILTSSFSVPESVTYTVSIFIWCSVSSSLLIAWSFRWAINGVRTSTRWSRNCRFLDSGIILFQYSYVLKF